MDKMSVIRTILLFVALGNQALVMFGYSPLPFNDAELEAFLSTVFTFVTALWAWWKNSYISKKGLAQKETLKEKNLL